MKNGFWFFLLSVLVAAYPATAKTNETHQAAQVIRVQTHEAESSYSGSNPTDAPLRSDLYFHDVWLKLDCAIYVVRYESSFDEPPPAFSPDRQVEVRVEKHAVYASMPGGRDVELSIVKHEPDSSSPCKR